MRIFGPPNIEKMKAKKNVKGLIKALGYWDETSDVPYTAALALGNTADTQDIEPLDALLFGYYSDSVKLTAVLGLGNIGNEQVV